MASSSKRTPAEAAEPTPAEAAEQQDRPLGFMFCELNSAQKDVMFVTTATKVREIRKFVHERFSIPMDKQELTFFRKGSAVEGDDLKILRPASGALEWEDGDLVRDFVSWKLKECFSFRCCVELKSKKHRLT